MFISLAKISSSRLSVSRSHTRVRQLFSVAPGEKRKRKFGHFTPVPWPRSPQAAMKSLSHHLHRSTSRSRRRASSSSSFMSSLPSPSPPPPSSVAHMPPLQPHAAEMRQMDCNLASLCDHIQADSFGSGAFSDMAVEAMGSTYRLHRLILSHIAYFRNMLLDQQCVLSHMCYVTLGTSREIASSCKNG